MWSISGIPRAACKGWTLPRIPMQFPVMGKPPVGIIFDSNLGHRIDTALALALLYGLDGKNEARVVSMSVTNPTLHAAAYSEVVGRFYAGAVNGGFGAIGRSLPIGMATDGHPEATPMINVPLEKKNADGAPTYAHGIHTLAVTAHPTPQLPTPR